MKKAPQFMYLFIAILGLTMAMSGCSKENFENKKTLKKLYKTYKNGEISECKINGQTVFSAGLNAYDAGSAIYDIDGKRIGTCDFGWGNPDLICSQLTDCEVVYRIKNNIWGQEPVDKYDLQK